MRQLTLLGYHFIVVFFSDLPGRRRDMHGMARRVHKVQPESSRARRSGQQRGYVLYLSLRYLFEGVYSYF